MVLWDFAGPLEHVAAAASEFSGHSDLLVASAAKETEYMRDSAAASVAAFVRDGQTDLLLAPAAKAFHYMECQNSSRDFGEESFCCHCSSHVRVVLVCRWILGWLHSSLEQLSSTT